MRIFFVRTLTFLCFVPVPYPIANWSKQRIIHTLLTWPIGRATYGTAGPSIALRRQSAGEEEEGQ